MPKYRNWEEDLEEDREIKEELNKEKIKVEKINDYRTWDTYLKSDFYESVEAERERKEDPKLKIFSDWVEEEDYEIEDDQACCENKCNSLEDHYRYLGIDGMFE